MEIITLILYVTIFVYRSMILSRRPNDDDKRDGFTKWPFMTTHTWSEYPEGEWILEVKKKCFNKFLAINCYSLVDEG